MTTLPVALTPGRVEAHAAVEHPAVGKAGRVARTPRRGYPEPGILGVTIDELFAAPAPPPPTSRPL
ncbi:MAG: hypothetical protein QF367_05700 [Acidimicrobiales bacterium]|nr:hypothetical protein [Acidimicrobiales bacterium]MDP7124739.1 hypothetical protein [Acidimicrobiales bacterium]MDP7353262.1 hypothetical protein [Acidimicrobiales bacterium]